MKYGVGITGYFNLQANLLWIFFILSIGAMIQINRYSSFNGLDHLGVYVTSTASRSFGNIGFSGSMCARMPIDWDHEDSVTINIGCQGSTKISKMLSSGLVLDRAFPGGTLDASHDCYLDLDDPKAVSTFEMVNFRRFHFKKLFNEQCVGKERCPLTIPFNELSRIPKHRQRLNTVLFVQAECLQDEETNLHKNHQGLLIACIGLFMCLFFSLSVRLMLKVDRIDE